MLDVVRKEANVSADEHLKQVLNESEGTSLEMDDLLQRSADFSGFEVRAAMWRLIEDREVELTPERKVRIMRFDRDQ